MKKYKKEISFFIKLMLIAVLSICVLSLQSCGTSKESVSKSQTKQTELTETKKDSSQVIERNKAINNEYSIPLRTADSLTNERIRQALSNFKAGAKSGSNSTNIRFDEDLLALKIASKIGETESKTTNTNTDTNTETSFEQQTDEYIEKKIKSIPWWIYAIGIFYFAPGIISRFQMIFNPLSNLLRKNK